MTDTPTTHKEMTLPESVTLYKVDIPNVGTMLTFAEPINPDCTFIMGEYTRHPKPMVQVEGVSNQRALNYVIHAEELIGNYTGNDRDVINAHGLIGNARAELEAAQHEDVSGEEQDNFNSAECIHGIHPDQCVTCTPAPIDAEVRERKEALAAYSWLKSMGMIGFNDTGFNKGVSATVFSETLTKLEDFLNGK